MPSPFVGTNARRGLNEDPTTTHSIWPETGGAAPYYKVIAGAESEGVSVVAPGVHPLTTSSWTSLFKAAVVLRCDLCASRDERIEVRKAAPGPTALGNRPRNGPCVSSYQRGDWKSARYFVSSSLPAMIGIHSACKTPRSSLDRHTINNQASEAKPSWFKHRVIVSPGPIVGRGRCETFITSFAPIRVNEASNAVPDPELVKS